MNDQLKRGLEDALSQCEGMGGLPKNWQKPNVAFADMKPDPLPDENLNFQEKELDLRAKMIINPELAKAGAQQMINKVIMDYRSAWNGSGKALHILLTGGGLPGDLRSVGQRAGGRLPGMTIAHTNSNKKSPNDNENPIIELTGIILLKLPITDESVIAHEAGHFVGWWDKNTKNTDRFHSTDPKNLMRDGRLDSSISGKPDCLWCQKILSLAR